MSNFFAAALSKIATPLKSFFSPSAIAQPEKNPIRTPPTPHWRSPLPSNLTPAEKKKRRVSFRKGFEVQGTTGWDTPVLPGEMEDLAPPSSPLAPTAQDDDDGQNSESRKKKISMRKATPAAPRTSSAGKVTKGQAKKIKPIKRAALSAKNPSPKKVKMEPTRDLPLRRTKAKKGFYNEKRLQNLVWKGAGTARDPIDFV